MNRLMLTTTVYVTFLFESRIHYHYAWAASCIEFCMLADITHVYIYIFEINKIQR